MTFENEFIEATKQVVFQRGGPYTYYDGVGTEGETGNEVKSKNNHSYFLDEQGCFNIGLYASDIPFALLSRGTCVYGQELTTRLKKKQKVEMCHFIGRTKNLYQEMSMDIFRSIYDDNYNISEEKYAATSDAIVHRGIRLTKESL